MKRAIVSLIAAACAGAVQAQPTPIGGLQPTIRAPSGSDLTIESGSGSTEVVLAPAGTAQFRVGTVASGAYAGTTQAKLLGNTALDGENGWFDVQPTITGTQSSSRYGLFMHYGVNTTGDHSWANGAILGQLTVDTADNLTARQTGLYGSVYNDAASGTKAFLTGGYFLSHTRAGGTTTQANGGYAQVSLTAGSTANITNAAGWRVGAFTDTGSGSMANIYGVIIEAPIAVASTKAWGFFQEGTESNQLAGELRVGAVPAADSAVAPSAAQIWVGNNFTGGAQFDNAGTGANGIPQILMRRATGTLASPATTGNGDTLGQILWRGYGADAWSNGSRAGLFVKTTEAWTNSAQGTVAIIETTPTGSTTRAEAARFTTSAATFAGGLIGGVQALSGAGAVDVVTLTTAFTSTGVAQALTMANGTSGQIKTIVHDVDGGSAVLTPSTKTGFSTVTFTNAGDTVTLQYLTTRGWFVLASYGAVVTP